MQKNSETRTPKMPISYLIDNLKLMWTNIWITLKTGGQQVQVQPQQQLAPQQSHSQLESQESLVQSQLADETDQVPHPSRKQQIKQVDNSLICKFAAFFPSFCLITLPCMFFF